MMVGIMQKTRIEAGRRRRSGVESQTSLAGRRRLLRSTTAARRNRREEALNVNNTKSINEKKKQNRTGNFSINFYIIATIIAPMALLPGFSRGEKAKRERQLRLEMRRQRRRRRSPPEVFWIF